jgi:1-acyl-sn-glycerol-3-phosphate acyltransferase
MLEAKKSLWFEKVFAIYNRNLLRRRFHSLSISGLHYLEIREAKMPLIIYANHSSWWDGLVISEILRKFDFDNYVMMEEKHLRKLRLFRKLGAFSVVRENPRDALRSIEYAASLLTEKANRMLLIFPQGKIFPNDVRPLFFYTGLARIVEKIIRCSVVPIAIRYEVAGHFKPEIFVKIGEPESFDVDKKRSAKNLNENFEIRLTNTLEHLRQDIICNHTAEYERFF